MTVPAGHLDDHELLLKAAAGDAGAVRRLLDEVGPTVYGFVFARVGGDSLAAEDVVQDTLLEMVRSAGGFRGDAALSTWVCAIARRRVARHWEAERRASLGGAVVTEPENERGGGSAGGDGPNVVTDPSAAAAFAELDERDVVIRALGQLPAEHRHVLVLKYLDGEPVAAIAEHLGRTPVSVQSLLQRARDGLREILEVAP
ncbi:MAG: RNA polymerase sigma factor [Acidimicrobiales bacterium]